MGRLSNFLVVAAVSIISCHPSSLTAEAFSPGPENNNNISHKRLNYDRRRGRTSSPFQQQSSNSAANNAAAVRASVVCHASPVVAVPIIATTSLASRVIGHGVTTFMSNWKAYSLIPFIAAFVGW